MIGFRAGDTVYHAPTGETWILAADQVGDDVYPCGWPETIAKAEDCEIVERATDDERTFQLFKSANISDRHDVRRIAALGQK